MFDDNWEALTAIKKHFDSIDSQIGDEEGHFQEYLIAYAFLEAFLKKIDFHVEVPELSPTDGKGY